jgi:hypothetical protein
LVSNDMRRADGAFVAYLATLAMVVAAMAANRVAVAGSASFPSSLAARQAGGVAAVTPSSVETVRFRAGLGALACHHHPIEWSLDGKFAPPPEGFVFSAGDGGGLGRVAGASVRAD